MQAADRRPEPASVLAISGSLRKGSVNSAALRAAAVAAARDGTLVVIDESSRRLGHLNPDLELGLTGAFKNALDWTVGSGALNRKPVTVLSVAAVARGEHVRPALDLVLRALGADIVHRSVPVAAGGRDGDGEIAAPRILQHLWTVAAELTARSGAPMNA